MIEKRPFQFHWFTYIAALLLEAMVAIGTMEQLRIGGDLINQLTSLTAWQEILLPLVGILGLIIGIHGLSTLKVYLLNRSISQTSRHLFGQLTRQIQEVHYQLLEQTGKADILTSSIDNIDLIQQNLRSFAANLAGIATGVYSLLVCLRIHWQLTLYSLAILPIVFLLPVWITKPLAKIYAKIKASRSRANSLLLNIFNNLQSIRVYGLEDYILKKHRHSMAHLEQEEKREAACLSVSACTGRLSAGLAILFVFALGAIQVFSGRLEVGHFLSFALIFSYVQDITIFPELMVNWRQYKAAHTKLNAFLSATQESECTLPVVSTNSLTYDNAIEVRHLSFSYPQADVKTLDDINLSIPANQYTAIVGPSGSGKSTLAKLLMGLYPSDEGSITVFGEHSNHLEWIRRQTTYVPQDDFLLNTTLRENLLIGNPQASNEELLQACHAAGLVEWDASQSLERSVGEGGTQLSGGERKRVCIARALLKSAPVLILDEPTASLDAQSESHLLDTLKQLSAHYTILVITHRNSTLRDVEKVIRVENGKVS